MLKIASRFVTFLSKMLGKILILILSLSAFVNCDNRIRFVFYDGWEIKTKEFLYKYF